MLSVGDIVVVDSVKYRIMAFNNWTESGFQKYDDVYKDIPADKRPPRP